MTPRRVQVNRTHNAGLSKWYFKRTALLRWLLTFAIGTSSSSHFTSLPAERSHRDPQLLALPLSRCSSRLERWSSLR